MVRTRRKNSEEKTVKKLFKNTSKGKVSVGNPRKRWVDDGENDLKETGIRGWKQIAKDSDIRKLILKEARMLRGL